MPWIESTALGAAPNLRTDTRTRGRQGLGPGSAHYSGSEATAGTEEREEANASTAQWSRGFTCDTR